MVKFAPLFSALSRKQIRYLLVTGTSDETAGNITEMIVDFEETNLNRFVDVLKEIGFKPKNSLIFEEFARKEKRETWIRYKGMTAFTVYDPENPADLLNISIDAPFDFRKVFEAREEMNVQDVMICTIPRQKLDEMRK